MSSLDPFPGSRSVVSGLAALLLLAGPAGAVDLAGTWHVLVHYQDSATGNPEAKRWEDRVWVIEREAGGLRWTEYPIVVLNDDTGRFEARRGTRRARSLEFWEPSPTQLAELQEGPRVNERGSVSKRLAGSDATGWKSGDGSAPASASVITFSASWSIENPGGLPVFSQEDSMGSAMTDSLEGRTAYTTESIEEGGNLLRGRYDRDGTRSGSFRLLRVAAIRDLGTEEEQRERIRKREEQNFREALTASDEGRAMIRDELEAGLAEAGVYLPEKDIDDLVTEAAGLVASGAAPDQIALRLQESAERRYLAAVTRQPEGAMQIPVGRPDPAARYRLPFDPSVPRQLVQGVGGTFSHQGPAKYSFDFRMPEGTPVLAARGGTVTWVVDSYTRGGLLKSLMAKANVVTVLHDDGTFASYVHLSPQAAVKPGDRVEPGQLLGKSGNTGYTGAPHLHFSVWAADEQGKGRSVDIRFDDGSRDGFVPAQGQYYGVASASR
jgi:murein DD-endopeptidase MepM/ murein hydrolase activator NlpD